jgi:hypothetical protein
MQEVNMTIADGRTHFYQYDESCALLVSGCKEVHFCHGGDEKAIVRKVIYHDHHNDRYVPSQYAVSRGKCGARPPKPKHGHRTEAGFVYVPKRLLESAEPLLCFGYTDARTLCRFYFEVKARPMPDDYVDDEEHEKWSRKADITALAKVAFSGEYSDLLNPPAIPSLDGYATEEWVEDQGYVDEEALADKVDRSELSDVATSGDYDDLINTPTIPVVPTDVSAFNNDAGYLTAHQPVDDELSSTSENPVQNKVIYTVLGDISTALEAILSGGGS